MKINVTAPHRLRVNVGTLRENGWHLPRIAKFLGVSIPHLRGALAGGRRLAFRRAARLHLKAVALGLKA